MYYLKVLDLLEEIYASVEQVNFVSEVVTHVEGPTLKVRLIIESGFIQVFFNANTHALAFALIKDNKRVFGVDRDNIRNWHIHPTEDPTQHIPCEEMGFEDFLQEVKKIIERET